MDPGSESDTQARNSSRVPWTRHFVKSVIFSHFSFILATHPICGVLVTCTYDQFYCVLNIFSYFIFWYMLVFMCTVHYRDHSGMHLNKDFVVYFSLVLLCYIISYTSCWLHIWENIFQMKKIWPEKLAGVYIYHIQAIFSCIYCQQLV